MLLSISSADIHSIIMLSSMFSRYSSNFRRFSSGFVSKILSSNGLNMARFSPHVTRDNPLGQLVVHSLYDLHAPLVVLIVERDTAGEFVPADSLFH